MLSSILPTQTLIQPLCTSRTERDHPRAIIHQMKVCQQGSAGCHYQPGGIPTAKSTAQSPPLPRHEGKEAAKLLARMDSRVLDCSTLISAGKSIPGVQPCCFVPEGQGTSPAFLPCSHWGKREEVMAHHRRFPSAQHRLLVSK